MTHKYFVFVISGVLAILGLLVIYFAFNMPNSTKQTVRIPTEYEYVTVPGPIQPIPTLKSIDENWVQLGKALFHSPLLSKNNTIACASCHMVNQGGDDGFPVSVGINGQVGGRNAPTVLNSVFNFRQFWDGRSADLAEQAVGPIHNPIEMGSNMNEVINKLKASPEFLMAFQQVNPEGITEAAIVQALVTFEESLITPNAPIDLFLLGKEDALTNQQKTGLNKFISFGCVSCHQGRNIGGNLYQRLGRVTDVPKKLLNDRGRFELTKNDADMYVFKVPSLRNIKKTAPYFHNGSVATLEEAVIIMAKGQLGIDLNDEDVADLIALFEAFNGEIEGSSL